MSDNMLQKLWDVYQIQQVMSRYEYFHVSGQHQACVDLFALKTSGVKVEIAELGIFEGAEGLKRFFVGANTFAEEKDGRRGHLHLHTLTTPVIEVAGDGQTAQGVWLSPGVESTPDMVEDSWCWVKYGVDFVKEEETWKMWHFHMYRIFATPYNERWSDTVYEQQRHLPPEIAPDRPNSYAWQHGRDSVYCDVPRTPVPYETWDESMSYIRE
jgi:hypothetical protein